MNKIIKNISIFIATIVILVILQGILTFFGINILSFLNYILWFLAIGIFYLLLPNNYTLFT